MYILDGESISSSKLKEINPDLIEDITILKDSAARLLYGSRGYNGVIIIKSKTHAAPSFRVFDATDGNPVPHAFIHLVEEGRRDTIRLAAGDKGEIITNDLKKDHSYKITISSAGYLQKNFDYLHVDPGAGYDFLLGRNEVCLPNILIGSSYRINCRRTGCCGLVTEATKSTALSPLSNPVSSAILARAYPNPLRRGASLTIEFTNNEEQNVDLLLFSLNGQSMRRSVARLNKGINRISINTGSHWPAGSYIVQLIDRNRQMLLQQKLIIE